MCHYFLDTQYLTSFLGWDRSSNLEKKTAILIQAMITGFGSSHLNPALQSCQFGLAG